RRRLDCGAVGLRPRGWPAAASLRLVYLAMGGFGMPQRKHDQQGRGRPIDPETLSEGAGSSLSQRGRSPHAAGFANLRRSQGVGATPDATMLCAYTTTH